MEKLKFLFIIEGIYSIIGRGTIVIGQVEQGEINQGDDLELIGPEQPLKTKCLSIEKNRLFVEKAQTGERVAIRLFNVSLSEVEAGMKLIIKD